MSITISFINKETNIITIEIILTFRLVIYLCIKDKTSTLVDI